MTTATHQKHHFRFYIVMISVVILGIFFLLFVNSEGSSFGITSLTVSDLTGGTQVEENAIEVAVEEGDEVDRAFSKKISTSNNEVEIDLTFDQIPTVQKKAKIKNMILTFEDLTTKIKVNDDRLELSNLQEVTLEIKGFEGDVDFDKYGYSLNGAARSISINGVTLASKGELRIAFDELDYQSIKIEDIELNDLELSNGNGDLKVSEKLTYSMEQDHIKMYYFNGRLAVDRGSDTVVDLEGVARGISVSGALLNFNLR